MKKILTACLLIFSLNAFSQADPEDGDGVAVPIDGGISLLLAAGAAYSLRTLRKRDHLCKKS